VPGSLEVQLNNSYGDINFGAVLDNREMLSILFADKQNHINGIENFWNQAKRHMRRFNGIPAKHFPLFLKECEWRFNNPHPKTQLKQLKQWVKSSLG
jgi:transposase